METHKRVVSSLLTKLMISTKNTIRYSLFSIEYWWALIISIDERENPRWGVYTLRMHIWMYHGSGQKHLFNGEINTINLSNFYVYICS